MDDTGSESQIARAFLDALNNIDKLQLPISEKERLELYKLEMEHKNRQPLQEN